MKYFVQRIAGFLILGAGTLGLVISLASVFIGLPAIDAAEEALRNRLDDIDQALVAAAEGLNTADKSLAGATETMIAIETTIRSSGQAISDTLPILDRVGTLVGVDIPRALRSTQQTLASARETARVADAVLGAISRLGLLGANTYNPEVPLNQAIQQVSDSLDPLPASLGGVRDRLTVTGDNLRQIGANTGEVAERMAEINTGFDDARQIINRYQTLVTELRADLEALRAALPVWFGAVKVGVIVLSVWFALAQIALFAQGLALLRRS